MEERFYQDVVLKAERYCLLNPDLKPHNVAFVFMKKKFRIRKNEEFSKIISQNKCVRSNRYTLFYDEKKEEVSRIGLSVSKKLGNSPVRNKIKRQLRMMFIENHDFVSCPLDFIVIVRKEYLEGTYQENKNELEKMIKKAIIKQYEGVSYE